MVNAIDVAACILKQTGPIPTMKLHRLLYYCQGWHLAWDGEPLFKDPLQAWANGPIVPNVYNTHRNQFIIDSSHPGTGDSHRLNASQAESVEVVLATYADWSVRQLTLKTHMERPWLETRGNLAPGVQSEALISQETLADYFSGLLTVAA